MIGCRVANTADAVAVMLNSHYRDRAMVISCESLSEYVYRAQMVSVSDLEFEVIVTTRPQTHGLVEVSSIHESLV